VVEWLSGSVGVDEWQCGSDQVSVDGCCSGSGWVWQWVNGLSVSDSGQKSGSLNNNTTQKGG
jgi:hypothetical protein